MLRTRGRSRRQHRWRFALGQLERDLAIGQQLLQIREPQIDDVGQLLFAQRTEDDDVVDAVEELRPEALPAAPPSPLRARSSKAASLGQVLALQQLRAEVRGHDEHRVLEVDGAALGVGEPAIVEHLQQDVEDIRMRLFDLVEEHDGYGRRRTASVSWPPSS